MSEFAGVVGYFEGADELRAALARAREAGLRDVDAYLPLPDPAAIHDVDPTGSGVRWVALAGGLLGIATAIAMTVWMSLNYPLITGGKPLVSWPPFIVVAFELMVLLGAISSIGGFLWLSRLPRLAPGDAYTPSVAVDRFALFVPCAAESLERRRADRVLSETGALDVHAVQRASL